MNKSEKIIQISSAHSDFDNRIFNKISKSLASHGYHVDLIIQHDKDETVDGIHIKALPIAKKKLDRVFKIIPRIFLKCIKYPPKSIFHFHDPELIPVGLLLKLFGYKVIYDIHEDNSSGILEKEYLPKFSKSFLHRLIIVFETLAYKNLHTIIAEHYYQERFPKSIKILNYPKIDWAKELEIDRTDPTSILYTGSITFDRGAINHVNLLQHLDESIKLKMIGVCALPVYEELKKKVGSNIERIDILGFKGHVPFQTIIDDYRKKDWIAGIALFPKTKFFEKKHLTKFFEYMAAGLPIIYSDSPFWKELLEPLNVGISVNPENPEEVVKAIIKLKESPELRGEMAKNGREAVLKYYNWETEESKLLEFYRSL